MKHFLLYSLTFCKLFLVLPHSSGEAIKTEQVEAELVSEWKGLVPGQTNTVALRLAMEDQWHSYWANPGETGLATEIEWSLPEGVTAGPIQWPAPQWIESLGLVSYGYEGEVFLLIDLDVAGTLPLGQDLTLSATASWLACKEACVPGSANLRLTLPVLNEKKPGPWKADFDATRETMPQALPEWEMKVVDNGESFALTAIAPEGKTFQDHEFTYFSLDGWVAASKPRTFLAEGRILTIVLPKTDYEPESGQDRFRGVLVGDQSRDNPKLFYAKEVNLPFSGNESVAAWLAQASGVEATLPGEKVSSIAGSPAFGTALFFAFVGGLMLNLMPCVFPVLSLKILGFVQQAGEDKSKVKIHGIVFTVGVLVSFWLLAGLFLILRSAGQEIGWGFQLQSPGFVALLASLLFLFGLNLQGVFEMGESLTGAGSKLQAKSGYSGSFFSGVLATVVATPCTAPFMGSALGIIITLSAAQSMLIFTALAVGVAMPYLILSFFPAFLKWLPRPGAWMLTFKKGLAFLLYLTVVWLAWVFGNQVGVTGMAGLFFGLIFIGIAAWIWGDWGNLTKKKPVRRTAFAAALLAMLVGGWIQYKASGFVTPVVGELAIASNKINWQKYSPEKVESLLAEGKTVYVDFTATWCLTCQVNKKVAFANNDVVQQFLDQGVVALKGDWTRRDPVITREIQKFGRSGVPTNVIYRPNGSSSLLPEVLTPGIVLASLQDDQR
jgi:thiol:disulfide interchange protein/DsbC/DsbD-like thiol-disulfide interchange protein